MPSLNAKDVIAVGIAMAAERIPFLGWTVEYRNRLHARYEQILMRERLATLETGQSEIGRSLTRADWAIHRELEAAFRRAIDAIRSPQSTCDRIRIEVEELYSLRKYNWRPELSEGLLGESNLVDRLRRQPEYLGAKCLRENEEPSRDMFPILLGAGQDLRLVEVPALALEAIMSQASRRISTTAFFHGHDDLWALPMSPPSDRSLIRSPEIEPGSQRAWNPKTSTRTPPPIPNETRRGRQAGDQQAKNHLRMLFCACLPGSFLIGSPRNEIGRWGEQENQVSACLSQGFWIGKYPVQQGEFEAVMGGNPSRFTSGRDAYRRPVDSVTWHEANEFCRRLTAREHLEGRLPRQWEYRLPTEAQWEYACRAGTTTPYCFGQAVGQLPAYAWFGEPKGRGTTHPVGEKRSNRWGIHDMHGNIREWCLDGYKDHLPGGTDPEQKTRVGSALRVVRGGGYCNNAAASRSAARSGRSPEGRFDFVGFRAILAKIDLFEVF